VQIRADSWENWLSNGKHRAALGALMASGAAGSGSGTEQALLGSEEAGASRPR